MHRSLFFLICLLLLNAPLSAEDGRPAVNYGRETMSYSREYEWLDLLGIQAYELTANIADPVFGARLRIEVWEPGENDKPKWSKTFGSIYTFKEKTPINCTFRFYFVPPKLKEVVVSKGYPAWLTYSMKRPGDWAQDNPTGTLDQEQLNLPENYLAIEKFHLTYPFIYDVHTEKFDRPLPFFHYGVTNDNFAWRATPEETRKANPHAVHIIGWLEPLLEQNDFFHPKSTTRQSSQPAPPAMDAPLLADGTQTPKWEFEKIDGGKFSSDDLRGKISVINFWATWCGHCTAEMPAFIDLQEKYGVQGVQFVGLNIDREVSVAGLQRFLKWNFADKPMNFPTLLVPQAAEKLFGDIDALPITYLVDAEGKVVYGCKGEITKADLEKRLEDLLAKKK